MFQKHYLNNFYQISDKYVICEIPKCGCSTIALQSLCYNEGKNILDYSCCKYKHLNDAFGGIWTNIKEYSINELHLTKDQQTIALYRDPIERYISAWGTTRAYKFDIDFHRNLITIKNNIYTDTYIDHHYTPQSMFYNFENIDSFIKLEDYQKFCDEYNIPWLMANKNISEEYKKIQVTEEEKEIIKDIYKDDYILLDKIRDSNKIYIPKQ